MGKDYDRILKENINDTFPGLCKQHLGIEIKTNQDIKDKIQFTLEREADFLQQVTTPNGKKLIIHLEFQSTDDPQMINRMHLYWLLLRQKYKMEIRQCVIYIGNKRPSMTTRLAPEDQYRGYLLIDTGILDHEKSLASEIPEEVVMVALQQIDRDKIKEVFQKIILRLQELSNPDKPFNKYLTQLLVFARIKKVTDIIDKLLQDMDITYNVKDDAFYKKGVAKGFEQGIEKGFEQGIEKGIERGLLKTALQMKKRGDSLQSIQEVTGLSIKEIKKLKP